MELSPSKQVPLPIDWDDVRHRLCRGDDAMLRQLIPTAHNEVAARLRDARLALETADANLLLLSAHTLKNTAGYFGDQATVEAALKLAEVALKKDLAQARVLLDVLEPRAQRLLEALGAAVKDR